MTTLAKAREQGVRNNAWKLFRIMGEPTKPHLPSPLAEAGLKDFALAGHDTHISHQTAATGKGFTLYRSAARFR